MYNHHLYLLYWLVNSVVLYFGSLLFPAGLGLGNDRLLPLEAAIYAGFWLTFIVWTLWDFVIAQRAKLDTEYVSWTFFWLVNVLGVLVVALFSRYTGFQVTNLAWAILLAAVMNHGQRWIRNQVITQGRG